MGLTSAQRDRAGGTLLATAAGDALGAGYEFDAPMPADQPIAMIGEWTDDTSMAIAIAEIAATGADLRSERALNYIVTRWYCWTQHAKDVGVQTRAVLKAAGDAGLSAASARRESEALHQRTGRTAGNGSLMRTAPVALAYLDDEAALVEAARTVSELTHFDPEAGDACVLWCTAIRHAILTGDLDVRVGLHHIDSGRRDLWADRLDEAEKSRPSDFAVDNNGWVVAALQAAWSAIATTPVPGDDPGAGVFRADHLRLALEAAVRGGGDTDTVAAIAGGLLGAVYGASAVSWQWRHALKGWPGLNARLLVNMAEAIAGAGESSRCTGCERPRRPVRHPHDDGIWLGGVDALRNVKTGVDLSPEVDVVVSLCRVDDDEIRGGAQHLDLRIDDGHPHLEFVLLNAVRAVEQLRADGQTVYLHCERAADRTPAVAALYGARRRDIPVEQALAEISAVLPGTDVPADLRAALQALWR
jgi:ADP-ribosyl-[dinitrogen reductase] hydrolase